jgi:hypothetical protein
MTTTPGTAPSRPEPIDEEELFDQETPLGPEMIQAALWRATHSKCGAEERWFALRRQGADDDTLKRHIALEFGSYGGCSSPVWHEHYGGEHPRLVVGTAPRAITLSGSRLLRLGRLVLEIPTMSGALQGRLF